MKGTITMPTYTLTLSVEANRITEVKKKLQGAFGDDVPMHELVKDDTLESRQARFDDAERAVCDCTNTLEELKDELQDWLDNMPENLQGGDKASELEDAISNFDGLIGEIESLDFSTVEFPGLY
jgi:hypothetical protein